MIKLKNVTKSYPAREEQSGGTGLIKALDDISLSIAPGEWVAMMGPSGSGKSTMVNLVGCLDRPTTGEIWLDDQNVASLCPSDLNHVRAETIGLFLHLSHETMEREGTWGRKRGSKYERILTGLQKAFASGQTYLPVDRLSRFLDDGEPITGDDIAAACKESGQYRLQGKMILRTL